MAAPVPLGSGFDAAMPRKPARKSRVLASWIAIAA
jgi:hypothetical protein